MNTSRTTFYREKQNAKLMGVCSGIADYTGVHAISIRLAFLTLMMMTGGGILLFYFLIGFLANKKPPHLYADRQEQQFWQGVRQSPARSARDVKASFRDIDRRLADIETYYVTHNPRLSEEIERLR